MISFGIKYWFILLLLLLLLSAGIVLLLYYRNKENLELSKNQVRFLSAIRFLSFLSIAFLLLSPFIRNFSKIIKPPMVIVAWDNSESMISAKDSQLVREELKLLRSSISEGLKEKYSIIEYTFGENSQANGELNFLEKKSDYSEVLSTLTNNHFNENVGAVILAGDGIYNKGKNPVNLIGEINFPVFALGFGDTSRVVDSRIQNIRVNRTSFSGNSFPVEVEVQFEKLQNKSLRLSIEQNGKELASEIISPPNPNYFYSGQFILEAGSPGLKHYKVKIEAVNNERNTRNNTSNFVINVLENKQKILFLSDGAHPDIGAIKNTLDLQKTYDVSVFTSEPYPADLNAYNLIIIHQLPTTGKSISEVIKAAENSRLPLLFILGNKTFLPQLNAFAQGITITPLAGMGEEAQATFNPLYASFNLSDELQEILPSFPPLQVPFADYELDPEFTTLFYQKILNIETGNPLIATGTQNGRKTGYIFGEGIWRWRLYDYYNKQSHKRFNELINQLVQYLALRENEDNFILNYNPVYTEIDDVILRAEVYNDAFERIISQEVTIEVSNTKGELFNFTFDVQGNEYYLNAGHLPTGDYTFSAEVSIGNEVFNETGSFTVMPINIEDVITRANHNMLYQLAIQSGGNFYHSEETEQLLEELNEENKLQSSSFVQEMVHELLNLRWIFFLILSLLGMEWFLRKYWGIY